MRVACMQYPPVEVACLEYQLASDVDVREGVKAIEQQQQLLVPRVLHHTAEERIDGPGLA